MFELWYTFLLGQKMSVCVSRYIFMKKKFFVQKSAQFQIISILVNSDFPITLATVLLKPQKVIWELDFWSSFKFHVFGLFCLTFSRQSTSSARFRHARVEMNQYFYLRESVSQKHDLWCIITVSIHSGFYNWHVEKIDTRPHMEGDNTLFPSKGPAFSLLIRPIALSTQKHKLPTRTLHDAKYFGIFLRWPPWRSRQNCQESLWKYGDNVEEKSCFFFERDKTCRTPFYYSGITCFASFLINGIHRRGIIR